MHSASNEGNATQCLCVSASVAGLMRLSEQSVQLRQSGNEPFPETYFSHMTFSPMATEIGVIAGRLQSADDMEIFAVEDAHLLIKLFHGETVFLCPEIPPAPLHLHMPGDLVSRCKEMINDCGQGYCRTHPRAVFLKIGCLAENSGSADQKDKAEDPLQVPVKLDVATIQLNRVINVQACFVVSAAITHILIYLTGSRGGLWWRVTVNRYLCSVLYITLAHEDSLIWIEVLGSAGILACESSPFLDERPLLRAHQAVASDVWEAA